MDKLLSIVIVTRNTKDLLGDLLVSIDRDSALKEILSEIIIVDNASADGTDFLLKNNFPNAVHVRNEHNTGFSRAVNTGTALATGEYILFLNSDTVVIEGEVNKMVRFLHEHNNAGICGPQLVYPDMKPQRSTAPIPSIYTELVPVFLRKSSEIKPRNYIKVSSLIGAAIMIRKDILLEVNGFDERFFFFLEETDLCLRLRKKGLEVVFLQGIKIIHHQGKTVRNIWIDGRMEYNISLYKFIKKHHEWAYFITFIMIRFLKAVLSATILLPVSFGLFGVKNKMRWKYYMKLVMWHFMGCPDDAGIRGGEVKLPPCQTA